MKYLCSDKIARKALWGKSAGLIVTMLLVGTALWGQSSYGVKVVNAVSGEPLIGVNIYTTDFEFSTATDINGEASLTGLAYREELVFSYIGFSQSKIPVYAIRRKNGLVKLFPDTTVDTIVVVGRRDDPVEEIPYEVQRIDEKDISFNNAQTSADLLMTNADVFVQKTQAGGGSPIIRGFEANRVLLVVDGVRLNNAIYRNGHLQNAITIDNAMLQQVEVIYGPGSLMYGSEALGGVVHYRTKDPTLLQGDNNDKNHQLSGHAYARFGSANLEKKAHIDVNYGQRKWGFLSSFSIADYDALRAGSRRPAEHPDFGKRPFYVRVLEGGDEVTPNPSPDVQVEMGEQSDLYRWWGTGFSQIDFLQKIKIQPSEKVYFVANYQVSTSSDVPRYDNLTDTTNTASGLKWAEWYYGPQFRTLVSGKLRLLSESGLFDKAIIIGSFQRIHEDRLKRRLGNRFRTINKEKVFVYTATADFNKHIGNNGRGLLTYGLDISRNIVDSKARNFDTESSNIILNADTRYPSGGSEMRTYGAYANYRWQSADTTFVWNGGLRYSAVNLEAKYLETDRIEWPENYYNLVTNNNSDITWATGFTWNSKDRWQIRLLAAKAFRAPNIDDWAKIRTKSNKVTIPNISLAPETAINFEATLAKEFGDFDYHDKEGTSVKISATYFRTNLRDAIVRVDSSTLEMNTLIVDDTPYDIQTNINAEQAKIWGFSGNLDMNIHNRWLFRSSVNYTKGTTLFSNEYVQDTIVPFAHIPPTYGTTGVTFQNKKVRLELNVRYSAKKRVEDYAISDIEADGTIDREGSPDNFEFSPVLLNEAGRREHIGVYGWNTINFYSSFKIGRTASINVSVENILDTHYRPFASNISAPGRNFIIALHSNF